MILRFARRLFDGERVVATAPKLSVRIQDEAFRRPYLFTGRALTADALILNAQHGIGHLQLFGRHVSSGVVTGLEITHHTRIERNEEGQAREETWLQITPGIGITHWGDDVSLPVTTQVRLENVRPTTRVHPPDPDNPPNPEDPPPPSRGLGFFVLQPVEILHQAGTDPDDQCRWDAGIDAFEDEQIVDGCRLVFRPWPAEELGPAPDVGPLFRNLSAYQVFDHEVRHFRRLLDPEVPESPAQPDPDDPEAPADSNTRRRYRPRQPLPWEEFGVPLGLTFIHDDGRVQFIDRHAVVRNGGAPLTVEPMLGVNGSPFLWEARIQQLVSHLQDLSATEESIPDIRKHFEVLPPVGLLPRQTLNLEDMTSDFLPSQFITDAVPIPEEQLEVALNASAGLTPFDLYKPEKMKLLVPVPQAVFEPDLLKRERVDPIFLATIRRLVGEIRKIVTKRDKLRAMAPVVIGAIRRADIPDFDEDEDKSPDEGRFPVDVTRPDPRPFHTIARDSIKDLREWIEKKGGIAAKDYEDLAPGKIGQPGEDGFKGIERFITDLERKIGAADDHLSTAFLTAQTDIYRLRQLLLGNVKASRLATSPVVGQIVEGRTGTPTADDVERYFAAALREEEAEPESAAAGGLAPEEISTEIPDPEGPAPSRASLFLTRPEFRVFAAADFGPITRFRPPTPTSKFAGPSRDKPLVERVYESPASEAKHNTVTTKANVFSQLASIELSVQPVVTAAARGTGLFQFDDYTQLASDFEGQGAAAILQDRTRKGAGFVENSKEYAAVDVTPLTADEKASLGNAARVKAVNERLRSLQDKNRVEVTTEDLAKNIREGLFDPDPPDGDEANYFSVGVAALEHVFGAMRGADEKLDNYRRVLARCRRVATILRSNALKWQNALERTDDKLAPLRHDALVTRSLLDEERARVNAINDRRRAILDTHVTSVAYVRPRLSESRVDVPAIELHAEYVSPVPACLAEDFEATDELEGMLDVLREVPVNWFKNTGSLLKHLDGLAKVRNVVKRAVQRANRLALIEPPAATLSTSAYKLGAYGEAVAQIVSSHQVYQQGLYQEKTRLDVSAANVRVWSDLAETALRELSLADLIEAGRGGSRLARRASALMERFEDVSVCLYNRCHEIEPAVRLRWSNTISVFDKPVNMRELDSLPGWEELDHVLRRDLQSLVDWLFEQVDVESSQPRKLINDLVRVCILLASHAPVSKIVRGFARKSTKGRVGDFVDLAVDRGIVKVGMLGTIYAPTGAPEKDPEEAPGPPELVVAQVIVQDIGPDSARVQVTSVAEGSDEFTIVAGARATFFQGAGGGGPTTRIGY